MKFRILFFICIIISSVDIASAQNLVTKKLIGIGGMPVYMSLLL